MANGNIIWVGILYTIRIGKMNFSLIASSLKSFAKRVGRTAARTPILLYFIMKSDYTAPKDKAIIAASLAYLVLPIDLIPVHRFRLLGWTDEFLAIHIVYDRMQKYITPTLCAQAEAQLDNWIKL